VSEVQPPVSEVQPPVSEVQPPSEVELRGVGDAPDVSHHDFCRSRTSGKIVCLSASAVSGPICL